MRWVVALEFETDILSTFPAFVLSSDSIDETIGALPSIYR